MSFGCSVGDFIAVGQLTWTVYRACKSAPGEFQELCRELTTLHTILHELEDEAKTPTSLLNRRGSDRKAELDGLLQNLSDVLKQIEDIVKRYHSLGKDQKRTWDRVKFAREDLMTLRSTLLVHMNGINVFIASLSAESLARIEGILDELIRDIKAGRKEPTVISTHEETDEVAWSELERELIGDGITKQDIEIYKEDIKEYLKKLIQENLLGIESGSTDSLAGNLDDIQLGDGLSRRNSIDAIRVISLSSSRRSSFDITTRAAKNKQVPDIVVARVNVEAQGTRTGSLVQARRERIRARAARRELARQYDEAELEEEEEDDSEFDSAENFKPVFLKGLFYISTTTTKPVRAIRVDIIRVLKQLGVEFTDIRGGFSCRHVPTIDISRFTDIASSRTGNQTLYHRGRISFGFRGEGGSDRDRKSFSDAENQERSRTSSDLEEYETSAHVQSELGGSMILEFEMFIVKVPLLSLHGIQFKRLSGGTWQYKNMAALILRELRL